MKNYLIITTLFLTFFLSSCDENRVFEQHEDLKLLRWYQDNIITFDVVIEDTEPKNLYVGFRHIFYFDYRNVWVKLKITTPDGTVIETPVDVKLAEPNGQWFGECAGDICDLLHPVPEFTNYSFPDTGKYHFEIIQDMRDNPLLNSMSVGLRIENNVAE